MIAVGTDIVEIERLHATVERVGVRFVERILTPVERARYQQHPQPLHYLAKRFAAKEAIVKALGTGIGRGVSWQDIEISNNADGAPQAALTGGAMQRMQKLGAEKVLLSLSDETRYAVAFAVLA